MSKFRNILLTVAVAVALFGVIGYQALGALTSLSTPDKSMLEGRTYQQLPEANANTVLTGTFQSEFEAYLSDSIPHRDGVLLTNSALQRKTIEAANVLFGFSDYPTFFDSDYVYDQQSDAVYERPQTTVDSEDNTEKLDALAKNYSAFIDKNDDVDWAFAFVDRESTSSANPASKLVANQTDYSYYQKNFLDKLPSDCAKIDLSQTSTKTFEEGYYKTDHHWQVQGGNPGLRQDSLPLWQDSHQVPGL